MKTLVAFLILVFTAAGMVVLALPHVGAYWKTWNKPEYRQAEVVRGKIVSVVSATGKVQPTSRVQIGSFVSGPVIKLAVDFNDEVKKGDLLAEIDRRIYEAKKARDEAALATREAEIARVEALLAQAQNDEKRAQSLFEENPDYISDAELDQFKFARQSLEAQLAVAQAAVKEARANLENSTTNLNYTEIRSPVDGIVIDRKIDPGQTLVAQFQTPELFVVGEEMDERMFIFASVNEAEIGLIREAERRGEKVEFTVDAYPDDVFLGKIYQIRINSTETQGVVTYPVVVEAPNRDLKLLPGMTANLSFHIEAHEDVLKVPNSALRFYPNREEARPADRKLLDGSEDGAEFAGAADGENPQPARNVRHVWVVEGDHLRAVEVVTGLSDSRFSEVVEGPLEEGQKLVTGRRPPDA